MSSHKKKTKKETNKKKQNEMYQTELIDEFKVFSLITYTRCRYTLTSPLPLLLHKNHYFPSIAPNPHMARVNHYIF